VVTNVTKKSLVARGLLKNLQGYRFLDTLHEVSIVETYLWRFVRIHRNSRICAGSKLCLLGVRWKKALSSWTDSRRGSSRS